MAWWTSENLLVCSSTILWLAKHLSEKLLIQSIWILMEHSDWIHFDLTFSFAHLAPLLPSQFFFSKKISLKEGTSKVRPMFKISKL